MPPRSALGRLMTPVFEAAMRRLEAGVSAEDHREAALAILRDGSKTAASAALVAWCRWELHPESESEPPGLDRREVAQELSGLLPVAFGAGRFERESEMHLGCLLPPVDEPPPLVAEVEVPAGASWSGDADAVAAARVASARLLGAARIGTPVEALQAPLVRLARTLEPGRWLRRAGTAYGSSALLRALLAVERAGGGEPAPGFTRELCERLLRHVEVLRGGALAFLSDSSPEDARPARERLRFAAALLEAAEQQRDLRFLNAALKLADRHHAKAGRPGAEPVTDLHYAVVVARQERLLRELLP